MKNRHALMLPLATCITMTVASAQAPIFREDFESGAPGWTFGGIWHIESDTTVCGAQLAPFPSPGHCAWFGGSHASFCDYDFGSQTGVLQRSTGVMLPVNTGSIALRYRRFLDSENCISSYDITYVQVLNLGGGVMATVADCSIESGWVHARVDLSAFAGIGVKLNFVFYTGDAEYNDTLGWCIDDVEIVVEPGVVTCVAGYGLCPCIGQSANHYTGNPGDQESGGCQHSATKNARLFGNGVQSVAADTVELVAVDLPQSTSLIWVQGLTQQAVPFGDGRRCFGGTAVRLAVHGVSGGEDTYPRPGEPGVALKGAVPAIGGTRTYQVVYRDAANFCTPSTFNTTNGYVIAWMP